MVCSNCVKKLALRLVANHPNLDLIRAMELAYKGFERYAEREQREYNTKFPLSDGWKPIIIKGKNYLIRENPELVHNPYDYEVNCTGNCGNAECDGSEKGCSSHIQCNIKTSCSGSPDACPAPPKAHSHEVGGESNCSCPNPPDTECSCDTIVTNKCIPDSPACTVAGTCKYACDDGYEWNGGTETCDWIIQHIQKTVTEILGLVDTKSRSKDIHRSVSELLGLLDTKSRVKNYKRMITELLGLVDTKSRIKNYKRIITEYLRLEDLVYSDKASYMILNGVTHDCILDVDFVEISRTSLPEWVNDETPDIDTNVWNRKPLKIVYTFRATHADKYLLDLILIGHSPVVLSDGIYGIVGQDVFMIDLEAVWEGNINYAKPWLMTIELIPC